MNIFRSFKMLLFRYEIDYRCYLNEKSLEIHSDTVINPKKATLTKYSNGGQTKISFYKS